LSDERAPRGTTAADEAVAPGATGASANAPSPAISDAYARYALVVLFLVAVFALIDRQIFGMLIVPIKVEFGVSDTWLGLASGPFFAFFYAAACIPIARLSDRGSRRTILAAGLFVWSLLTLLSGLATNFVQLLLARAAIGVGEAAGTPTAHALIADAFPPERRARALSVYTAGASIGVLLAYLLGGWIQERWGWQGVFFALGTPGVLLALLVRTTIREPRREHADGAPVAALSTRDALARLFAQPAYRFVLASFALHSLAYSAAVTWQPAYLARVHGMAPGRIGTFLGLGSASFMALGVLTGGIVTDRLARTDRRWLLRLPGFASLGYAPLALLFLFAPTPWLALVGLASSSFLTGISTPGMHTAIQELADASTRATAAATNLLLLTLIGSGLGPPLVGVANDLLASSLGNDAVRWSLALAALVNAGSGTQALLGARWLARPGLPAGRAVHYN